MGSTRSPADRPRFCARREPHERLAILGVFTADEHGARRSVVRHWLTPTGGDPHGSGLLARFVARGQGSTPLLDQEAVEYGDVVFLRAPASMSRNNGPLLTLILWLECAVFAWPHATLIGKADDDVWVHVDATTAHLQGSLRALRDSVTPSSDQTPQMYWGLMETYGWSFTSHRPIGFGYKYGRGIQSCTVKNQSNHSFLHPIHFAKGPMYFVSTPLVTQIVADSEMRAYALTVIASANSTHRERTLPWEDVFTGLALSRSVRGVTPAFVHMGSRIVSEAYGVYSKFGFGANTLLFHTNTAKARGKERYAEMHRWALQHHCRAVASGNLTLRCNLHSKLNSCAGTAWKRCLYVHDYQTCPISGPQWKPDLRPASLSSLQPNASTPPYGRTTHRASRGALLSLPRSSMRRTIPRNVHH